MRRLLLWAALALASLPVLARSPALPLLLGKGVAAGPSLSCNFLGPVVATATAFNAGPLCPPITFTRASSATDSLYTDAAGSSYNTYAANVPIVTTRGLGVFEQHTNYLLNSTAPATQTTGTLTVGTYVFWCIGTGNVTLAAATAVGSGFASTTCSLGTFATLAISTAGTVLVTVSGSVDRFQLEGGGGPITPTPFIVTAATLATRAIEQASIQIGPRYNNKPVTLSVAGNMLAPEISGSNMFWASLNDGTLNNRLQLFTQSSGLGVRYIYSSGGVAFVTSPFLSLSPYPARFKAVATVGGGSTSFVQNGVTVQDKATGPLPVALNSLQIGTGGAGAPNGFIFSVAVYPRSMAISEMQRITR
jgi:hypothetical protein